MGGMEAKRRTIEQFVARSTRTSGVPRKVTQRPVLLTIAQLLKR